MISCKHYDFLEIACMRKLSIKLTLSSGDQVIGVAADIEYDKDKKECLKITTDNNVSLIRLDAICTIQAHTDNDCCYILELN